jgi:hypothetical protein
LLAAAEGHRRAVYQVWAQLRRGLRDDRELAEQYRALAHGAPVPGVPPRPGPTGELQGLVIVETLSKRELEVLGGIAEMLPTEEIAATVGASSGRDRDRGDRGDRPRRFGDDREGRGDRDRGRDFAGPPRGGRGDAPWREGGPGAGTRERPGGAGAQAAPREPSPEPRAGADERAYQGVSGPPGGPAGAEPGAVGTNRAWTYQHLTDSWQEEERLRGWTPGDQDLQEMVEDNIEADPQLNARDRRNIQVRAEGGVVTLAGTVRSRLAKYAAGSDAYWTYGVREVRNELDVRVRGPQGAPTEGEAQAAAPTGPAPAPTPAPAAAAMSGPDVAAPTEGATGGATTGTDTVTAEQPAPAPKRATRRRAAATATTEAAGGVEAPAPTRPSADTVDIGGDEALSPLATGGDSADSGEPGFMPPLESPEPNVPVEGRVEPPAVRGAG